MLCFRSPGGDGSTGWPGMQEVMEWLPSSYLEFLQKNVLAFPCLPGSGGSVTPWGHVHGYSGLYGVLGTIWYVSRLSLIISQRLGPCALYLGFILFHSALCPVRALREMLDRIPSNQDSALFQIPHGHIYKPLTDSAARKHLESVSTLLALHRSLSMNLVGVGHLGPFLMGYLFKKSRPKEPGLQTVSGDIFPYQHLMFHKFRMPLDLTSFPSLLSPYFYWVFGAPITSHSNTVL